MIHHLKKTARKLLVQLVVLMILNLTISHLPQISAELRKGKNELKNRTAIIIANASLEDMGIISDDNIEKIINRTTLRRQIEKKRKNLKEEKKCGDIKFFKRLAF